MSFEETQAGIITLLITACLPLGYVVVVKYIIKEFFLSVEYAKME